MSCDWETVKTVVPGNSSMKPDQTGGDGKGVKQSEMFNYSVYSRLGNNIQLMHSFSVNIRISQPSKVMSTEAKQRWTSLSRVD